MNNFNKIEKLVEIFVDDQIGKEYADFYVTQNEVKIQAGTMDQQDWINMAEELCLLIDTKFDAKYQIQSVSKNHVTICPIAS